MALTIDGSDPTGDLGDLLASKADYPTGGSNGDLLTKSGTTTAWAAPSVAGLTLIDTLTISAASSGSINGCFSATYTNYVISLNIVCGATQTIQFRFRASGNDNTASNYGYRMDQRNSSGSGSDTIESGRTQNIVKLTAAITSGDNLGGRLEICNPFNTSATRAIGHLGLQLGNIYISAFGHNSSTSFDGFSLIADTGTFSGTVKIYGLRD